jgi:hypothetical protein
MNAYHSAKERRAMINPSHFVDGTKIRPSVGTFGISIA